MILGLGTDIVSVGRLRELRTAHGERFLNHVELQSATVDNDLFPAKKSGELEFHDLEFRAGGDADGEFVVTFEGEGSLSGWFSGIVDIST